MGDISKNFWHTERACRCSKCRSSGHPYEIHRPKLMERMELMRSMSNIPLVINSWCRCEEHNKESNGVDSSSHVDGWAVDIRCNWSRNKFKILKAAMQVGFTRIGVAKTFIHLDMDPSKPPEVTWTY